MSMHASSVMSNFATPWTVAHQVPLSLGFSRQEYWSGLPFPPPGDIPDPGIEPCLLYWQANSFPLSYLGSVGSLVQIQTWALFYWESAHI